MNVFVTIEELRAWRRSQSGSLGLVPTMGFLHAGHLALIRRARAENDKVGVSIFANPLQFRAGEDFERYPRDLPRDLNLLEKEGVDAVFTPSVDEMYPAGFSTTVEVGRLTDRLEGAARPGHFSGVATVVSKLFNIFQPDRAYFGQKDAQQAAVIRKLASDLSMPLAIVVVPTLRDVDGVALSSRNVYLSEAEREMARAVPRALRIASSMFRDGERGGAVLRLAVRKTLLAGGIDDIDYVSLADPETLEELETIEREALLSLAVRLGNTRLIDNVSLGDESASEYLPWLG